MGLLSHRFVGSSFLRRALARGVETAIPKNHVGVRGALDAWDRGGTDRSGFRVGCGCDAEGAGTMRRGHDPTRSVRILDSVVGVDVRLADRLAVLMAGEAEPQSRPSHISCVSATGLVSMHGPAR
jgi:hypothetical protein